jgi:uncharacterized protein YdaU (DUF1376 family)
MSMAERGIYITLLSVQWLDGKLPAEPAALADIVRLPVTAFQKLWTRRLASCFEAREGGLANPRLESERDKQATFRALQGEKGKKGGRPKGKADESRGFSRLKPDESRTLTEKSSSSSSSSSPSGSTTAGAVVPRARTAPIVSSPLSQRGVAYFSDIGVPVPNFLHDNEFRPRLMNADGLTEHQADDRLRAWYAEVEGRYLGATIGEPAPDFWRARFAEWQGTTASAKSSTFNGWQPKSRMRAQ